MLNRISHARAHVSDTSPPARAGPAPGRAAASRSVRYTLPVVLSAIGVAALFLIAYFLADVLLLVFAGVLLAIMLRTPADALAAHTRLSPMWALAVVAAVLIALLGGAGWLFGHTLVEQMTSLAQKLPEIAAQFRDKLAEYGVVLPNPAEWLSGSGGFLGRGFSVLAATFGAMANLVVVLFVGIFFAAQPRLYTGGLLALLPQSREARMDEVLQATGHMLRRWLFGQMWLMLLIGAVTGTGLWLLGVPYAFALSVIAGLLEFIPYVGPLLSAVPAVLVALSENPALALYVALFYLAVQTLEGNIIQPMVQHRTVYLPPAAILISQLMLGVLLGALGVMLATPLAAAGLVWVRMLYVEDALGKRLDAAAASPRRSCR